jgi:hypothetical protein
VLFRVVKPQVFLNATCSLEWCDFCVEIGLKEKWYADISVRSGFEDRDAVNPTYDTLGGENCYGMWWARMKTYSDSPIIRPAVYYAVNRAFIKTVRPNLPH